VLHYDGGVLLRRIVGWVLIGSGALFVGLLGWMQRTSRGQQSVDIYVHDAYFVIPRVELRVGLVFALVILATGLWLSLPPRSSRSLR
jgi:hypothetical protein